LRGYEHTNLPYIITSFPLGRIPDAEYKAECLLAFSKPYLMVKRWMFEANHLVLFTGAGISTESGLSDFRDQMVCGPAKRRGCEKVKSYKITAIATTTSAD